MRILVVSHTYIVDLNREKLRALAAIGGDTAVTVIVPRRWVPGGVQNRTIFSEPVDEGAFQVIPIDSFSQNNQGLMCFTPELIKVLREKRPQILQVEQGSKSLAYAQTIALNQWLGLKAQNVFFTWWNLPYRLKPPVSWLERYNLSHTDGAIPGNQDGADILRQRGYRGPLRVLPQLGVDTQRFYPQPQPQLKAELGLPSDAFIIGFVGRFVPEKGLLTLCSALAQLKQHPQPWRWLLVGRGPLQETLKQRAQALGICDRICWVESVPHDLVPRYINLMDTLVLPSETDGQFTTLTASGWKEQFGHVLIEAMACQVPVIGSDSGEIPHVIDKSGLIFPEGDATALATAIRTLLEWPQRRQSLANMGYKRASEKFTNQALAQQMLNFYQELLAAPASAQI